ncbi:hypothetical protein HMPREF0972_02164 [Actinomyces sp. oral taxon 848 str. F0332]|nr:hypothetical protein HMPREF0972_02164 [Actinomyces sp. oral taxon 848 str. F0332]
MRLPAELTPGCRCFVCEGKTLFSDRPSAKVALGVRLVFARLACIGLPVDSERLFLSGSGGDSI